MSIIHTSTLNDLPRPDEAAMQHSRELTNLIQNQCVTKGPMEFDRFMELCLYAPGLGYYSAGTQKFGAGGDFITAPELGSLFASCIARQCTQVLSICQGNDILEIGAGSGQMAFDILNHLNSTHKLPDHYFILELSASLKRRQQQLLSKLPHEIFNRVSWQDTPPSDNFSGILIANEVLDALPIKRFLIAESQPMEILIDWDANNHQFVEIPVAASGKLVRSLEQLEVELGTPFPENYTSEVNIHLNSWLETIVQNLTQGAVLLIDYGYNQADYYHPDRNQGSLLCHYRQHAHSNPFFVPGLQDITASVDFTRLAHAANSLGLTVNGYTTQAHYLLGNNISSFADTSHQSVKSHMAITQEIKRLTLPNEMGDRFKAMLLCREIECKFPGFQLSDRRGSL